MATDKKSLFMCGEDAIKWEHDGKLYALYTEIDEDAPNPREDDDGNLAVLACWHRRYTLGDKLDDKEPLDFWRRMVEEIVPAEEVLTAALAGKFSDVRAKPNEERPELVDIYEVDREDGQEYLACDAATRDYAHNPIIEVLGFSSCQTLLAPYAAWLPLWLYDHSGLSISCGDRTGQFADEWDSGQLGWAFITKKSVMEQIGTEYVLDEHGNRIREEHKHPGMPSTWSYKTRPLTEDTWKARAIEDIKAEVERYGQYVSNEVYYYKLYQAEPVEDGEEPEWEEIDCCGGFFGMDITESGIADEVGRGLSEAIEAGTYTQGTAEKKVSYSIEFNF